MEDSNRQKEVTPSRSEKGPKKYGKLRTMRHSFDGEKELTGEDGIHPKGKDKKGKATQEVWVGTNENEGCFHFPAMSKIA